MAGLALLVLVTAVGAWELRSPQAREQRNWRRYQADVKARRYPEAVIALQNILQIDPRSAQAYFDLGTAYLVLGDLPRASAALTQTTVLDPSRLDAQLQLGELLYVAGRFEDAHAKADLVLGKAPANRDAWLLRARSAGRLGHWGEAIATLETLLKRDPAVVNAHLLLGDALMHQRQIPAAVSHYHQAAALAAKDPRPHYGLGIADRVLHQDDRAVSEFEAALTRDPNSVAALVQVAGIDWARGDQKGALTRVEQQIARAPRNLGFRELLGFIYLASGNAAAAQQAFAQAIQVAPQQPAPYLLLGSAYARGDLYELATRKFQEALTVDPNNAFADVLLGLVRDIQGQPAQAKGDYLKAIALNPRLVVALNNLAWDLATTGGDLATAQQYAQRALALAPHDPRVLDTAGWILYKQTRYDEAVLRLAAAARQSRAEPAVHYHLGMAYLAQGHQALAREELEAALRISPAFPGAADAKKTLGMLH